MYLAGLVVQVAQWFLLAMRGQTIGKMVLGTKIIRVDGRRAHFVHTVALRVWPLTAISLVQLAWPALGSIAGLVSLADALFIFRRSERRTLHDRIPGTIVIDLALSRGSA